MRRQKPQDKKAGIAPGRDAGRNFSLWVKMMPEVITSRKNEWVRHAAKLASSAEFRRSEGLFIIEGARLCADAADSGIAVRTLFYTEQAAQRYASYLERVVPRAARAYLLAPHVAELLAETKTTQGVFCICEKRPGTVGLEGLSPQGHLLAVENLQDPGNLGAVLRTAEALGLSGVLLAGNCCDVYSPKVLRASMGAVFRLPFRSVERLADVAPTLRQIGFALYAAVPDRTAKRVTELSFEKPSIIAVGNEGNGLEAETVDACGQAVTIPMRGRAESLNAAASAAILMWELMRD